MRDQVVLVDGERAGSIPATDSSVLRGDGCFEAIRCYAGRLFRTEDHLDRLERSASALGVPYPPRQDLRTWMAAAVEDRGDCIVRVVLTRGSAVPGMSSRGLCVVVSHPLPEPASEVRLWPIPAPWHPAGRPWELSGVKTISYAPNLAASRRAVEEGATDALLISDGGLVLEGPTFSVAWVTDGQVYTPALTLGILDSITRRVVGEIYPGVVEVEAGLEDVLRADEIFVMSTIKEVAPVTAVADRSFGAGRVTGELAQRFRALVGH